MSDASKKSVLFSLASVAACGLVFSLAACDDSTSVGNDELADSSSSVIAPESSSAGDEDMSKSSSSAVRELSPDEWDTACDEDGALGMTQDGNFKYGYGYRYYRCEEGIWTKRSAWILCDTVGVFKGEVCRLQTHFAGFQYGKDFWTCYKYAGEGAWEETDCPTSPDKECNAENEGAKEMLPLISDTLFFRCSGGDWRELNLEEYYCSTGNEALGDICSFERFGKKYYFRYDHIYINIDRWVEGTFDPELGFCSVRNSGYKSRPYAKKGEEYYYCVRAAWRPASLVPQQYTDPRKEGLTDEEYDVLDLPKEAAVGERAVGLLEYCSFGAELQNLGYESCDYCFPIHFYRYRGDGVWTEETHDDRAEDVHKMNSLCEQEGVWCCAATEGMELVDWSIDGPSGLHRCVSGEDQFVGYYHTRYKKVK